MADIARILMNVSHQLTTVAMPARTLLARTCVYVLRAMSRLDLEMSVKILTNVAVCLGSVPMASVSTSKAVSGVNAMKASVHHRTGRDAKIFVKVIATTAWLAMAVVCKRPTASLL
jgi:hypothetical protein